MAATTRPEHVLVLVLKTIEHDDSCWEKTIVGCEQEKLLCWCRALMVVVVALTNLPIVVWH